MTLKIKRYNIATASWEPGDFYVFPETAWQAVVTPNGHPGEILALPDGTVVTYYTDDPEDEEEVSVLVHLSATGEELHKVPFSTDDFEIDHISYSPNGSDEILLWLYASDGSAWIGKWNLISSEWSEMTISPMFSQGHAFSGDTTKIGPSNSCSMHTSVWGDPPPPEPEPPPPPPLVDHSRPCLCDLDGGTGGGPPGAGVPEVFEFIPCYEPELEGGGDVHNGAGPPLGELPSVWQ